MIADEKPPTRISHRIFATSRSEMGSNMNYKIYLDYTMDILSHLKISCHIIDSPFIWNEQYDGGLRKTIWNDAAHRSQMNDFNRFVSTYSKDNTILIIHDSFCCEYIYLKLPDSDKIFIAGPFSFEKFTNQRITELCTYNSIPARFNEFMQLYYAALPVFTDERFIESIINTLCSKLWTHFTIEKKRVLTKNNEQYIYNDKTPEPTRQSIEMLEMRYKEETLLMESIAHGDYKSIENMRHLNASDIKPRLTDTIRDRKNFMIILNTICRKAAQSAYVHPVHLDEISRKFAIKIEACTSIAQLEALESDITRRYCMLVQSYSLRTYSKPVQNIINYISFNLTADLSLTAISTEFSLNSSYLSTLFKKETGTTLTNYVNGKRMDHAIYLLNTIMLPIQDIAVQCGINDVNYFTKLFKKTKNKTPTQYRELVQKKH